MCVCYYRAVVPTQTQAIESVTIEKGGEKEWYYGNADKERNGPVGFTDIKDLYKVTIQIETIFLYYLIFLFFLSYRYLSLPPYLPLLFSVLFLFPLCFAFFDIPNLLLLRDIKENQNP